MADVIDVNNHEQREQFMFELILRLRQCAVNPLLVINGYRRKFQGRFPVNLLGPNHKHVDSLISALGTPSKSRLLCQMILKHCEREKAIVFCEFREEMSYLQQYLSKHGITSALYDGTLTGNKREEIVQRLSLTIEFLSLALRVPKGTNGKGIHDKEAIHDKGTNGQGRIDKERRRRLPRDVLRIIQKMVSYDVVLVQINSGNAGLNLQMCSRVYFTSPNWNPCTEIQAVSRAHRCGQTKPVVATKLVMSSALSHAAGPLGQTAEKGHPEGNGDKKTIDHRILYVQTLKRAVMADILNDTDLLENGDVQTNIRLTEQDARFLIHG
jgi:hypothetical protein